MFTIIFLNKGNNKKRNLFISCNLLCLVFVLALDILKTFHNSSTSLLSPTSALPKQFEVTPADLAIHLNDTAMFECQSPGLPTPDVRWFRESVPLTPGPRTHIYPSGVLEVAMVTMADFAQYRCEVSNMERSRFSPFARLSQDLEGELFSPFSPICMLSLIHISEPTRQS